VDDSAEDRVVTDAQQVFFCCQSAANVLPKTSWWLHSCCCWSGRGIRPRNPHFHQTSHASGTHQDTPKNFRRPVHPPTHPPDTSRISLPFQYWCSCCTLSVDTYLQGHRQHQSKLQQCNMPVCLAFPIQSIQARCKAQQPLCSVTDTSYLKL
jgi:hypothetical protein